MIRAVIEAQFPILDADERGRILVEWMRYCKAIVMLNEVKRPQAARG